MHLEIHIHIYSIIIYTHLNLKKKKHDRIYMTTSPFPTRFVTDFGCLGFHGFHRLDVRLDVRLDLARRLETWSRDFPKRLVFPIIQPPCLDTVMNTLQEINISHLGKRKIIFKMDLSGDMLIPGRVNMFMCCFFAFCFNYIIGSMFGLPLIRSILEVVTLLHCYN